MEIVASLPTSTPGANSGVKKHVEEWSRLDRLTGMLETARVEADHWANNTSNSRHRFGKVVDSRARNLADGSVQQQQQTKQLEVFQAHIPGGSVQVIRSHTSTTSSWHNSKVLQSKLHTDWSSSFANKLHRNMESPLDNLKLQHNQVNLESEKTKANVARHLPPRRPPTRTKVLKPTSEEEYFSELPKICHDMHNKTEKNLNAIAQELKSSLNETFKLQCPQINGVTNEDGGVHLKLEKKKSISDENLNTADEKENSNPWKRDAKARWSSHFPRSKYKDGEHETDNKSELEFFLKKVLQRNGETIEKPMKPAEFVVETTVETTPAPWKRKSFVTEETLKQTKQKLRHLNGHECKIEILRNDNEEDDGICTESKGNSDKEEEETSLYVKDKEIISTGTGSLECRGKNKSDDWFDRRKSYGFEPVYGQRNNLPTKNTSKTNLSTDSGICRSSELELASTPIMKKLTEANEERMRKSNDLDESLEKTTNVSELLNKFEKKSIFTLSEEKSKTESSKGTIRPGKVAELIKTLRESTLDANAFEAKLNKSNVYLSDRNSVVDNVDAELIPKRHSIACDDSKYICKMAPAEGFPEKLSSSVGAENGNTTVVNVNNYESGDVASSNITTSVGDTADTKKPKKVEFCKTEVHFAAAEPGKIKIVETNEKPPPANLHRRKKRNLSTSPKIGLPQTRFGDKPFEECNRENSRNNIVETHNEINDEREPYRGQFASAVSDNGLAVRISSMKPTDVRRASWSVLDSNENKAAGYSTKINFDGEGVTVVADAKSHHTYNQFKSLEASPVHKSGSENLDEISEKSHFKPLRSEEEKLKTVTNYTKVDIKRPKITSVAVNLTPQATTWSSSDENNSFKKCTTVLLNNSDDSNTKTEPIDMKITNTTNERNDLIENKSTPVTKSKDNSFKIMTTVRTMQKSEEQTSKHEYKPVKVIHHGGTQLPEQRPDMAKNKDVSKTRLQKTPSDNSTGSSGSMRRKTTYSKEKLWDSGRDSWLNLPKDRKLTGERKMYADCMKVRPTQMRRVVTSEKESRGVGKSSSEGLSNGYLDASSEDDAFRRSYRSKHYTKPMTTISEKASLQLSSKTERNALKLPTSSHKVPVTRTTSNSSLESHSNSHEFRRPVLKTEERSRRRAARLMQRASSREALMNAKSSSEDITSENEISCLRSNKVKSPRKAKIPKTRAEQAALLAKPNVNRLIKQKSGKMQINIFNIKDKREQDRVAANQSGLSRAYPLAQHQNISATASKTRCQPSGQKEAELKLAAKPRNTHRTVTSNIKDARMSSNSIRVPRSAAK